jgi:branched-chain amino acid transport system permease protein
MRTSTLRPPRPETETGPTRPRTSTSTRSLRSLRPLIFLAVLLAVPFSALTIPGLFDGPLGSPGVLQLLAVCLVFAGLATGYDLLFGRTGMLSFGHGLFVATGMYTTTILVDHARLGLLPSVLIALTAGVVLALLLGAVALRVPGIGFAMVTLAFAQAASILVINDTGRLTGGEEGQNLNPAAVPAQLSGIHNTVNLYWLALAYLVLCVAMVWWASASIPGQVWRAIRENEQRVQVLGLNTYLFKLLAFAVAAALATGGGIVYLLLLGGATPAVTTSDFTLALLVMVVLGGAGTRWGPIVGGLTYTYASQALTRLSGSTTVASLPGFLRGPMKQPLFLLGALFVIFVLFAPGGFAALPSRFGARLPVRARRR